MKNCAELAVEQTAAYNVKNKYSVLWNYNITNMFVWENDTTSYFSACLNFGACYIMGKWGEFKLTTLIYVFINSFGIFCFFYQKICVFIIFIYFFRIKYQISATNINESETGIGGPKLPLELYVTYQIE